MLSCEEGVEPLRQILDVWSKREWSKRDLPAEEWWQGVHGELQGSGERWRQFRPSAGFGHLDILVPQSTVHRLAPGAWEFLEERGLSCSSVQQPYPQLVCLQNPLFVLKQLFAFSP